MPRKSTYEKELARARESIKQAAPENCATIEEALTKATILSDLGLCAPASLEDFTYCKACGKPCWHDMCQSKQCPTNKEIRE